MSSAPAFLRRIGGGVCEIRVRVVPGASRSEIVGALGDRLKIRIASPAEGGNANRAVVEILREWLGVSSRDVEIASGLSSRDKTLRIAGIGAQAEERLKRIR